LDRAHDRLAGMEKQLQDLWSQLTGGKNVDRARKRVWAWAAEHPLNESLANRISTESLLAGLTTEGGIGPFEAAAKLVATTDDLVARLDLDTATMPKVARWQGEYLIRDVLSDPTYFGFDKVAESTTELNGSVQQLSGVAQAIPSTIRRERMSLQGFLADERAAVLRDLHSEREATLAEVNQMGLTWIDHSFDRTGELVDRVFRRLLMLTALLVVGVVAVLLSVGFLRRSRSERRPPEPRGRHRPAQVHP
jgi:hypothetical protein